MVVVVSIIIVSYLPAGTRWGRIIKNIWWKVGLRLPVEDQVLQRLHPADLLAVDVHRRVVLRDPLPGPRPRPVSASARVGELCNRRSVTSRPLSTPPSLTFRVHIELRLGRLDQVEPSEAVRGHEVRCETPSEAPSEASSPGAAAVPRVQAAALTVPALSLTSRGQVRAPPSSSSCSALTAGLARPDPHHLPRLDHLLCNKRCVRCEAVRLDKGKKFGSQFIQLLWPGWIV